ncbi:MAG: hypothetical protein PVG03_17930 [Desulfarculaceae bacterium]
MSGRVGILAIGLVLALCPLLMGMGIGDSEGPTRIPEPQADYRVRLIDQEGTKVELTQFSVDGQAFILGDMGKGEAAISLEKIKEVELNNQGGVLKATVVLAQGEPVVLEVNPNLSVTGKTKFGNYRIPLGQVTRLEVVGLVKP